MNNRVRYTRQNLVSNSFYQMPKFLFDAELPDMSDTSKVLYSILRNRHELSIKNEWFDENGEVFIYFKREDLQTIMKRSDKTIAKAMKELKDLGLLEEVRQGVMKPNKIYLLSAKVEPFGIETAQPIEKSMTRTMYDSRPGDSTSQDPYNVRPIHNNKIHNNINKKESESASAPPPVKIVYGKYKHVRLTAEEHESLVKDFGIDKTLDYIDRLDRQIECKSFRSNNHCCTIEQWITEDKAKEKPTQKPVQKSTPNRFANFEQRVWSDELIQQMETAYLRN